MEKSKNVTKHIKVPIVGYKINRGFGEEG